MKPLIKKFAVTFSNVLKLGEHNNVPGCSGKEQLRRGDESSCGYEISHSMKKWI